MQRALQLHATTSSVEGRQPKKRATAPRLRRRRHPCESHSCWRCGAMAREAGGGAAAAIVVSGDSGDGHGGGDGDEDGRDHALASRWRRRVAALSAGTGRRWPSLSDGLGPWRRCDGCLCLGEGPMRVLPFEKGSIGWFLRRSKWGAAPMRLAMSLVYGAL